MTEDPLLALHRHFEEQYGTLSLPGVRGKKRKRHNVEPEPEPEPEPQKEQGAESEEEWQGFDDMRDDESDDENDAYLATKPEVVSFTETTEATEESEVVSYKSFMSSKLPRAAMVAKKPEAVRSGAPDDDEALNLQNDIALQRLLRESNLLSEHATKDDPGRLRHLTLDARISHLGGKEIAKGNVPLRIRKGIQTAKKTRQEKGEREAQEAGILMPVKRKAKVAKPRERGLNTASAVGKFKNGMLKINEREIRRVNNSGSQGQRRGKSIKKLFK